MRPGKLLKYARRIGRDVVSLARHRLGSSPDILFVAGSQVDLQWVLPAYEAAKKRGINCAFAGPFLAAPKDAPYFNVSAHAMRFLRTRITVTATTGLSPRMMPQSERRVAVPHSLVSLHMVYPKGTFDAYSDVFCCGRHHLREVEAMNAINPALRRRPVLVGYGKFERLSRTRPPGDSPVNGRRHVLIGPSWGPGNILESVGELLIARLLAEGYRVTLRPHPSFFTYGDSGIAPLIDRLKGQSAFTVENSVEESRALWTADYMIADYSGFAMEFAFMRERPVLYVDVPSKVLNPDWQRLGLTPIEHYVRNKIGVLARPDVDDVMKSLKEIECDLPGWQQKIRQERSDAWVNFGSFGEACMDELVRMLDERAAGAEKQERVSNGL